MKPKLKRFKEIASKFDGNISNMAEALGVSRGAIYRWIEADNSFRETIEESRGRVLDELVETAKLFAKGVPRFSDSGEFAGWQVQPDGQTLRYLLGTLGKKEGFGESVDITSKGESIRPEKFTIEVIDRREQIENQ